MHKHDEHIHLTRYDGTLETLDVSTPTAIAAAKARAAKVQDLGLNRYTIYRGEGEDEIATGRYLWVDSETDHPDYRSF